MKKRIAVLCILVVLLLSTTSAARGQNYYFSLDQNTVHVFWNADGTVSLDYQMSFTNDAGGHAIEYVDLSLPTPSFDVNSITADVNGIPVASISRSGYQGDGVGVAIEMGPHTIAPGQRGSLHVSVGVVRDMLFYDPGEDDYVSGQFSPAYFDSSVTKGTTDLTVIFHLPPGVQPEEPRWHQAPAGFPEEPVSYHDEAGRVVYEWNNPQASPSRRYVFGASFPQSYVPADEIESEPVDYGPSPWALVNNLNLDCLVPFFCIGGFLFMIFAGALNDRNRKLKYLPPKIAIEGHGIKRGLTAIEAAVLMEQPVDKVLTMILFAVIKKNAAQVTSRDPLTLQEFESRPTGLRPYEEEFLDAFKETKQAARQRAMQTMFINLVNGVAQKMKGFSRKETIDYYQSIMVKAWEQVEAAGTPEVKSQKFDEVMEWTMLDRNYDDRTRDVFRTGPVFLPTWWGRYDPAFGRATSGQGRPVSTPSTSGTPSTPAGGGQVSMPTLPGADFAQSIVGGVTTFSQGVVGNITSFTDSITQKTNPLPKSTSSTYKGGGGGSGGRSCACACACACAGCACACAGGGR